MSSLKEDLFVLDQKPFRFGILCDFRRSWSGSKHLLGGFYWYFTECCDVVPVIKLVV